MPQLTTTLLVRSAVQALALIGLACAANASATVDLIWADSGTPTTSAVSTTIVLNVILTAGPNGSAGAGVSVDYSEALDTLTVIGYASTHGGQLPHQLGSTTDSGTQINNINSHCASFTQPCHGLMAGESHMLGTVQFHNDGDFETFTLPVVIVGIDGVADRDMRDITNTTTFNPAFVSNVPEPDFDGDRVGDQFDNCSEAANAGQDDTDGDDCGNVCDADYDQNGRVGWLDFGTFFQCFGTTNPLCQHVEPIGDRPIGFPDFGMFSASFGSAPGPSGTLAGTTACP